MFGLVVASQGFLGDWVDAVYNRGRTLVDVWIGEGEEDWERKFQEMVFVTGNMNSLGKMIVDIIIV